MLQRTGKRISKNDFRKEENKASSLYKLYVVFRDEALGEKLKKKIMNFFSYNTKSPNEQLKSLEKLVEVTYKGKIQSAILYDNKTGKELDRWSYVAN
ncbi:MAG: hypothetical protein EOP53_13375 [Sphingobacteriales bacterium]|nr:MAG: hypothetical protein EOP53_13375 [Sphingobacteriales bacterium]